MKINFKVYFWGMAVKVCTRYVFSFFLIAITLATNIIFSYRKIFWLLTFFSIEGWSIKKWKSTHDSPSRPLILMLWSLISSKYWSIAIIQPGTCLCNCSWCQAYQLCGIPQLQDSLQEICWSIFLYVCWCGWEQPHVLGGNS